MQRNGGGWFELIDAANFPCIFGDGPRHAVSRKTCKRYIEKDNRTVEEILADARRTGTLDREEENP